MQLIQIEPQAPGDGWCMLTDRVRLVGHLPGRDVDLIEVQVAPGSGTPPPAGPPHPAMLAKVQAGCALQRLYLVSS